MIHETSRECPSKRMMDDICFDTLNLKKGEKKDPREQKPEREDPLIRAAFDR